MDTDSKVNINLTKENLSSLYDKIYDEAEYIISGVDECKSCIYNYKCCKPMKENCKYLSDTGCTVKCLACKLYICKEIKSNHTDIMLELDRLSTLAKENCIFKYYTSKEDILNG